MLWALICKELRVYRAVIIAAIAIFILGEIGVPAVGAYVLTHSDRPSNEQHLSIPMLAELLLNGAALGLCFNCLLAAALGGTSLPIERRENWADLPAMLPVSRSRILFAKLIASVFLFACFWSAHAAATYVGFQYTEFRYPPDRDHLLVLWPMTALLSVGMFGIAWMLSMFVRSAAIAAAISIGVVAFAFILERVYIKTITPDEVLIARASIAAIAGVVMLIGSWTYYLRRVAP